MPFLQDFSGTSFVPPPWWYPSASRDRSHHQTRLRPGAWLPRFFNGVMVQSEMFHWIFSSFTIFFYEISLRDVHRKLKKSALVDARIMILLIDFHRILIWVFPFKGGSTVSIVCSVVSRLSLLTLVFFSKEQQTHLLGVLGLGNLENNDP